MEQRATAPGPRWVAVTAGYRPRTRADDRPGYLADSLDRVGRRQARARLGFGPQTDPEWLTCADVLSSPTAFDDWRQRLAGWLTDTYGESPDQTTASYVMSWYLSVPAYVAALLFHHERRVPSLRPADLAFRVGGGRPHPDGIAVLSPRFTCLPDDPAAGTADAAVVPDEQALAAVLRGRFAAHATRFVEAYSGRVRLGRRTLWAGATDALDSAFWLVGRNGGEEGPSVLDAALVLGDGSAPFTSASTLRALPGPGPTRWTRRRESCCFHYLVGSGEGLCSTCPRLRRAD